MNSAAAIRVRDCPPSPTNPIHVTHFMRKAGAQAFSIETLYRTVRDHSSRDVQYSVFYCPEQSSGILPRIVNILAARRAQTAVNHVTGDVHYLTYLLDRDQTVLTVHDCGAIEQRSGIRRLLLWFFWYWLPEKRCAAIVTVSHASKDRLLRYVRCSPDKIHVIPNPVDPEIHPSPLYFNRAMPRILVVGTTAHKNIERYAAALADVPSHLVIVGALNDSQTRALARRNRPYENLVSLSREEIRRQYALCDLVLFASTYEGFGLPIVEAQAAGRPVVTSNIPPMSDVAGDGACLVDPLDVDSLRQGVFRVVNDDSYRARLIEAGKKNVRRFEADVIAHHYCRLYKYIASKGDAGHKTGAE